MSAFRGIAQREIYADEPHFSDELLLPSLVAGHHLLLVTAFLPSYLVRLVDDLAKSPIKEPGNLTVVFCIPFNASERTSSARLISNYLCALSTSSKEIRGFIDNSLSLAREGGLRFGALMSKSNLMLTPGCCGLIESGEPGSKDMLSFVDATPGDFGSPITVNGSWEANSAQWDSVFRVVSSALNKTFHDLLRLSHDEILDLFSEIKQNNHIRGDSKEGDAQITRTVTAGPSRATPTIEPDSLSEEEMDFELSQDIDDDSYEIARILREVNLRELGFEGEDLTAFLGESTFDVIEDFELQEREHVPPLSWEIAEWLGRGFASCWCGATFPRESGCPERYW